MSHAVKLALDPSLAIDLPSPAILSRAVSASASWPEITLTLHDDLRALESEWRALEESGNCTVFQTFDWLERWQRHIGDRKGVTVAVVVARHQRQVVMLLPLGFETNGTTRRITWLASYISNYNAPVLAAGFSALVSGERFAALWQDIGKLLADCFHHDLIDLEKMPGMIGGQPNPFCHIGLKPHVNDAYLTHLGDNWETYYAAKRSGATRKRDRKKRKHLAEHGEVALVTATEPGEITRTLNALIDQKSKAYARMGVANMFDWPGYREFFAEMARHPRLVHVCRLEVGNTIAAANYGLIFRDTYYYILAGYDDGELARFGPGMAQLHELLRYSILRGLKVFDFTIGDERYKREWFDTEVPLYDCVTPATWRGYLLARALTAVRRIKRRIKQDQKLWDRVRQVRTVIGPLMKRSPR